MSENNVLSQWQTDLSCILRARQPGVVIFSTEEPRVISSILPVIQYLGIKGLGARRMLVWSAVKFKELRLFKTSGEKALASKPSDKIQEVVLEPVSFQQIVTKFAEPEEKGDDGTMLHQAGVLVLTDIASVLEDADNRRALREALWTIRGTSKVIIVISKQFNLPEELVTDLMLVPFELPTSTELLGVFENVVKWYRSVEGYKKVSEKIKDDSVKAFARACAGLTETEAIGLLQLSVSKYEAIDERAVKLALDEKAKMVRRTGALEYETCQGSLDDVGGVENLKSWIRAQDAILTEAEDADKYGLKMPSGVVFAGVSGTGKTLLARTLAAHWGLPLLRFDVGRAFGKYVGDSEANTHKVITIANAIQNCVVFIDEVDKALSGGDGETDGGTTARVKGMLLTWLQEKPRGVFVVMTANNLRKFDANPEFLRAGRVDAVFALDLPNYKSRFDIFKIHLKKAGHVMPEMAIVSAVEVSRGYSGAEIEVCVQTALRLAFNALPRLEHPTSEMLVQAVKAHRPLSVTMKESLDRVRAWIKAGRAIPAGEAPESDDVEKVETDKSHGLPLLIGDNLKG